MKGIKLIIFDLDGTLADAYPAITGSFNYTMRMLGYPFQSAAVIRQAVGWGDDNLLKPFIKEKDLSWALSIYRRHHKQALVKDSRLFPQARKVLEFLKDKGYCLAVASNRPTRFSWVLIRHLKIKIYFDYILCADRLKHIKPHPEIINTILKKFRVRPAEAVYVGDMTIDAQAGRRARVRTIIVTTGSSRIKEIRKEKPCRIIKNIGQLLKIF